MVKVKIYKKAICLYCIRSKMLLKSLKQDFEEETVDDSKIEELAKETGLLTVPQIFIDGKCIGGCDDLYELKETGKLDKLLG
jgi:glutaredoxin 3